MSDTRTIVVSIVGTGLAVTTVVVAFTAIIASGIDARFDDVNSRIDDVNRNVNSRVDDVNRNVNSRVGDLDTRMARLEIDIRELRTLVIDAIKGDTAED